MELIQFHGSAAGNMEYFNIFPSLNTPIAVSIILQTLKKNILMIFQNFHLFSTVQIA